MDIIYDGKTKLLIKTKLEGIITKELKYCTSAISIEKEKKQVILAEEALIQKCKAAGYSIGTPVICKKSISPIDEHWNNQTNIETYGNIEKILKNVEETDDIYELTDEATNGINPEFILTNLKSKTGISLNPDDTNNRFSMNDCKLAYTVTLEKLEEHKSKAYILKQLEKLKDTAMQIDKLDIESPDYDLRLRSLNKIYQYIKDDINSKIYNKDSIPTDEKVDNEDLNQEFDLIESIVTDLAGRNGVDAEAIWEDLETLTDDELYVFAVTTEPVMESEAWQKANNRDRTDGMSQKAVNTYRREHPGSKLKTAVTTKPSKLKKGSKASKRRKSYCSRSRGQMKMHNISCSKTPDKAICKARRRWNC